jgi:hypothetical protein
MERVPVEDWIMPIGFWDENGPWVDANTQRFRKALCTNEEEDDNSWSAPNLDVRAICHLDMQGYLRGPALKSQGASIYVVFDTSGSMGGNHMEDGCAIMAIFNALARQRIIDFHFVATGYTRKKGEQHNCWYNKGVPLEDWCWESIDAWHGTEGISQSMTLTKPALLKADLAFAYTDACICDVDLKPSLWRDSGKTVTGLYSGNEAQEKHMARYFDDVIARRNKEELAEAVLHLIRAKQKG